MASRPNAASSGSRTGERRPVLKIILLGDSNVGKTALMRQFVSGKFDQRYKATIGADFFTHEQIIQNRPVNLQIWDTAGQERFQSLGSAFYRGADACMLVFDITSNDSFAHMSSWLDEFRLQAGDGKHVILVGNKSDLQDRRQVFTRGINQWCLDNGTVGYVETSAKDNVQVAEAFRSVATAAFEARLAKSDAESVMPAPMVKTLKKEEAAGAGRSAAYPNGGGSTEKKRCEC